MNPGEIVHNCPSTGCTPLCNSSIVVEEIPADGSVLNHVGKMQRQESGQEVQ